MSISTSDSGREAPIFVKNIVALLRNIASDISPKCCYTCT